jgi:hypothetical protein
MTSLAPDLNLVEVLRLVPLFADLDVDELQTVGTRCSERRYAKGDTL